jgi:hypothetical protein
VPQREQLRDHGYTEEKLREAMAPVEPLEYLPNRTVGKALVIGARYDTVVPPASSSRLIEALADPSVIWIETGHYGGFFVQRRLYEETAEFFGEEFAGRTYHPPDGIDAPTLRLTVQYNVNLGMDIGVGMDLLSAGRQREYTATGILTPRGVRIFLGRRLDRSIAIGVSSDVRGASFGVLWSAVL